VQEIKTYELVTFNVKRPDGTAPGETWEYNWYAVRSNNINDRSFYEIQGIPKDKENDFWSLEPRATFKFLNAYDNETVQIYANVRIIRNEDEICISKPILQIKVVEDVCPECIPMCGEIIRVDDCATNDTQYKICCEDYNTLGIDAIEFIATNGILYDSDDRLSVGGNKFAVLLPPNTNCAYINVHWDINETEHILFARARKGESDNVVYSEMVKYTELMLIPDTLTTSVIPSTQESNYVFGESDVYLSYKLDLGTTAKLFPDDYIVSVYVRERTVELDTFSPWSDWDTLLTDSVYNLYTDIINTDGRKYYPDLTSYTSSEIENVEFEFKFVVESIDKLCSTSSNEIIELYTPECDEVVQIGTVTLTLICIETTPEIGNVVVISTTTTCEDDPDDDIPDNGDGTDPTTAEETCFDIDTPPGQEIVSTDCFDIDIPVTQKPDDINCFDIDISESMKPDDINCFDIDIPESMKPDEIYFETEIVSLTTPMEYKVSQAIVSCVLNVTHEEQLGVGTSFMKTTYQRADITELITLNGIVDISAYPTFVMYIDLNVVGVNTPAWTATVADWTIDYSIFPTMEHSSVVADIVIIDNIYKLKLSHTNITPSLYNYSIKLLPPKI